MGAGDLNFDISLFSLFQNYRFQNEHFIKKTIDFNPKR